MTCPSAQLNPAPAIACSSSDAKGVAARPISASASTSGTLSGPETCGVQDGGIAAGETESRAAHQITKGQRMGKRGRRLKPGKREPNGRLSRRAADRTARMLDGLAREERDALAVGLEARQRVHGVPARNSRDQMAGSYIGRLCISGEISRVQYDAAMQWLADGEDYSRVRRSPRPPGAVDLNRIHGGSTDGEDVAFARRAVERYEAAVAAVQERQLELRNTAVLFAALSHIVGRDLELPHMVGDCREALNALARVYKLSEPA